MWATHTQHLRENPPSSLVATATQRPLKPWDLDSLWTYSSPEYTRVTVVQPAC